MKEGTRQFLEARAFLAAAREFLSKEDRPEIPSA